MSSPFSSPRPSLMLVFPTSIAKSMGQIHSTVNLAFKLAQKGFQKILGNGVTQLLVVGFHHDAKHRLSSAWAYVNPSSSNQAVFGFAQCGFNKLILIPGFSLGDLHVHKHLRPGLVLFVKARSRTALSLHDSQYFEHGCQTITRWSQLRKDNVSA